jgi:repressor LexA
VRRGAQVAHYCAEVGNMKRMTFIQVDIYNYIRIYKIDHGGNSPTIVEIAEKFGRNPSTIQCHLQALIKKGYITMEYNRSRSIQIIRELEPEHQCLGTPDVGACLR